MNQREPDPVEQAQEIDLLLRAIRKTLRRPLETEFARGNLTGPQRSVMQEIVQAGGLSLKDLSRRIGLAHSTVSGIVDRLARRGLLERRTSETDRRLTHIVPTPAVRNFVQNRMPQLIHAPLVEALSRAQASDRTKILDGLRTLRAIVEKNSPL